MQSLISRFAKCRAEYKTFCMIHARVIYHIMQNEDALWHKAWQKAHHTKADFDISYHITYLS